MSTVAAVSRSRADDLFFPGVSLLMLGSVALGFAHSYFLAGMLAAPLPTPLVHVHAALFVSWILIATAQPLLVSAGRVAWHRRLGRLAMVVATALPVVGVATLIGALRLHDLPADQVSLIFAFDMFAAADFAVLLAWGLRKRNVDGAAHKRLMLLATMSILGPAISRWPFSFGIVTFFVILDAFPAALIAYDFWTLRSVRAETALGAALIVASQAAAMLLTGAPATAALIHWLGG